MLNLIKPKQQDILVWLKFDAQYEHIDWVEDLNQVPSTRKFLGIYRNIETLRRKSSRGGKESQIMI